MIKIEFDEKTLEIAQNLFAECPEQVKYAASRAINRTATAVRAELSGLIIEKYDISSANVKKAITIKRSMRKVLRGVVGTVGRMLPITYFNLSPKPKNIISALRAGEKIAKAGPMLRYLKTRYPLDIPYGPSIPQMAGNKDVLEDLAPFAEKVLNRRFLHEVSYRYGKFGGR